MVSRIYSWAGMSPWDAYDDAVAEEFMCQEALDALKGAQETHEGPLEGPEGAQEVRAQEVKNSLEGPEGAQEVKISDGSRRT